MLRVLPAFAGMFALDFICARYTMAVTKGRAIEASATAALMIVLTGAVVLSYVGKPLMLLPAAAGAFCGTYAADLWTKRFLKQKDSRDGR